MSFLGAARSACAHEMDRSRRVGLGCDRKWSQRASRFRWQRCLRTASVAAVCFAVSCARAEKPDESSRAAVHGDAVGNAVAKVPDAYAEATFGDTVHTEVAQGPDDASLDLDVQFEDDTQPPSDATAAVLQPGADGELCALGKAWAAGQCQPASFPFEMVLMPAVTYDQGCDPATNVCDPWEMPVHTVTLGAFLIGKNEVTVGDYKKCVKLGKCKIPSNFAEYCPDGELQCRYFAKGLTKYPVNCVTKSEALQYCKAMVPGGTLPSDAQWERAARTDCTGPNEKIIYTRFVWGDQWIPPKGAGNFCDEACDNKYWGYIDHYQDEAGCSAPVTRWLA